MNLLSEFFETSAVHADRIALVQENRFLSYADLRRRVQGIATFLTRQPADGLPIALALNRGVDASIAVLAILSAGLCYLPLDLKNPADRLARITRDADASIIIGSGARPDWVSASATWISLEEIPFPAFTDESPAEVDPESLACILYTSGSTGSPKGVALSHRALRNFSSWAGSTFAVCADDRIASLAPFHFDLSIFDLFAGLSSGASIHFVPDSLTLRPSRLSAWLDEFEITIWYTVPSLLNFLVLKAALETYSLKSLRTLLFAGEVMPPATLIRLSECLPHTSFYNLFGPTETNVCCYWPVDRERLVSDRPIPIGKSACGSQLAISDSGGELLVKGDNLFSGYWSAGSLLERVEKGAWYATGDRVSIGVDGDFRYHGRIDRMLKCSGYRVEPAEIESVIRNNPIVEACAVVGIEDETSGRRPAAAVVLKSGTGLNDLVPAIRSSLPAYMQPVKYLVLKQLPRLSNGKTDYLEIERDFAKPR